MGNYVYKYLDKHGSTLYVGRTNNLDKRMYTHSRESEWYKDVSRYAYAECKTKTDMYMYEIYYIHCLDPIYNKDFKDDEVGRVELDNLDFVDYEYELRACNYINTLSKSSISEEVRGIVLPEWNTSVILGMSNNARSLLLTLFVASNGGTSLIRMNQKEISEYSNFGIVGTRKTMSELKKMNVIKFNRRQNYWIFNPEWGFTGNKGLYKDAVNLYKSINN